MTIKWKKGSNIDCLLGRINQSKTQLDYGGIAFTMRSGFAYHMIPYKLKGFLGNIKELDRISIVHDALYKLSIKGDLNGDDLLKEIKRQCHIFDKGKKDRYFILTSISLEAPKKKSTIKIGDCKLRIYPKNYLKFRDKKINEVGLERYSNFDNKVFDLSSDSENISRYAKIIIEVNAVSEMAAMHEALKSIDLFRATRCLVFNPVEKRTAFSGMEPVNVVILGPLRTIHKESGELVSERVWYDPSFSAIKPFKVIGTNKISQVRDFEKFLKKIDPEYSKKLIGSLLIYVRALG